MKHASAELAYGIGAVLLAIPFIVRARGGEPLFVGASSYAWLDGITPLSAALLLILLGLATLWLLDAALQPVLAPRQRAVALLFTVANPAYVTLFTTASPAAAAVPVALLALLAARRGNQAALLLALLLPFLSLPVALGTGALMALGDHGRQRRAGWLTLFAAAFLFAFDYASFGAFGYAFTEFGAHHGISLFMLVVGLYEAVVLWLGRSARKPLLLLAAMLILPFHEANLLVGLATGILAAMLFLRFHRQRWMLRPARFLTAVLTLCILFFVLIVQLRGAVGALPSRELVDVLGHVPDGARLYADEHLRPYARVFINGTAAPQGAEAAEFRRASRRPVVEPLLERHGTTHVLLARDERREGLAFLVRHSQRFEAVAITGNYELWRVT